MESQLDVEVMPNAYPCNFYVCSDSDSRRQLWTSIRPTANFVSTKPVASWQLDFDSMRGLY
jgi:hypothetical protein